jgi:hypothetical protein
MTIAVLGYILLLVISAAFVGAARWAYHRSKDLTVPIGAGIIYFWTCAGAWLFMADALNGYHGFRIGFAYYYLMEKMFPFELDGNYLRALLLHGTFLAGVVISWWAILRRMPADAQPLRSVDLDHRVLWGIGSLLSVLSIALVLPDVATAMVENTSIYLAMSSSGGIRSTLRGLASQYAAFCLVVGYALRRSGTSKNGPFTCSGQRWCDMAYPVSLILTGIFLALIGDRHPLFISAMVGALIAVRSAGMFGVRRVLPVLMICAVSIVVGGWVRSYSWQEVVTLEKYETPVPDPYPYDLPIIAHVPQNEGPLAHALGSIWTNELFAAHMSMYGVLRQEVPVAPGISFNYLAHAFIPSFLAERPITVYDHYARYAGLTPGQGYTIHHDAAWYLNIGVFGPLVGGFVLGLLWICVQGWTVAGGSHGVWRTLLSLLPVLFVAYLPQVLRSGPEAYKSLLAEGIILPLMLLAAACWPSLVPAYMRHQKR